MNGWGFFDDNGFGGTGNLVFGPGTRPLGAGSAHLAVSALNQGFAASTAAYAGTRFDTITTLSYNTYRTSGGAALAISLGFDVDYDVTDLTTSYQGRLTYEPYYTNTVTTGSRQSWDTLTSAGTGNWWASRAPGNVLCPISNPCTWSEVLTNWPNAGVWTPGGLLLKAGSGWASFDGNADALTIGISGSDTTYDFEPECPTTCYVNTATGDDTFSGATPGSAKKTIKAAISSVSPGGTVIVASGTYTETGQIVISKNMTIVGAGAGTTIIKPSADTGSSGDARGWFLVNEGITFNLNNVTLDGTGRKVWQAIRDHGQGTISDCALTNIKFEESGPSYAGTGIVAFGMSAMNVNVTNCTFSGIGRVGVLYFGTGVTGSTFSRNTYTGKGAGDHLDYAVEVGAGANATITRNTISGDTGVASVDGSTSAGVLVTTFFGAGTTANITENFISGSTTGVAVGFDGSDTSAATVYNNSLTGNTKGVVSTAPLVDASANWWGSNTPAGVAAQVSSNVDYTPWLDASTDTAPATPGFQGAFSTLDVDDDSPQTGTTGRVQEGVNLVTASTVNVAPGTYVEQVEITKPLDLVGSGKGVTFIQSPVTLTKFFTTSANNYPVIFVHDTNGVTVKQLTVDGAGRGSGNYRFVGIGYSNAGGSIDTVRVTGVRETPINGNQHGNAIFAYANSGTARSLSVASTDVDDYQKNGMTLSGANLTVNVSGSKATGAGPVNFIAQNGIQLGFGAGGTIQNNETSGHDYTPATFAATGILLYQAAPGAIIRGNHIHDNMEGAFIQESSDVIVDGNNQITNSGDTGTFFYLSDNGQFNSNTATSNNVAVWIADSNGSKVQTSTISGNQHGVIIDGNSTGADILGNNLLNNTGSSSGIHVDSFGGFSPSSIRVHYNNIVGNGGSGGLGLFNGTTNLIDAENNWWGACNGPSGPGGTGSGDPVSLNVDFTPFLNGKCDNDNDLLTNDQETFIYGTDPNNPDTDKDGCADGEEILFQPQFGGQRNPLYFWDFYDVWTRPDPTNQPNLWVRDKVVNLPGDILGVASRFGATRPGGPPTKAQARTEALTPPTSPTGYHADYDRGQLNGPNPWNLAPPDGTINIPNDILGVAKQFGHSCAGPP